MTPVKPEKTPVQRVRCFSALSSGLTPLTPPPPMKNARRAAAAGHKTTQRRRRPPVRRRTTLIWTVLKGILINTANHTITTLMWPENTSVYRWIIMFMLCVLMTWILWRVDNIELDAQISTSFSRCLRQSQVRGRVTDWELQDVHICWNQIHCRYCVPESQGQWCLSETHNFLI